MLDLGDPVPQLEEWAELRELYGYRQYKSPNDELDETAIQTINAITAPKPFLFLSALPTYYTNPTIERWSGFIEWTDTRDKTSRFLYRCPTCEATFIKLNNYDIHREGCLSKVRAKDEADIDGIYKEPKKKSREAPIYHCPRVALGDCTQEPMKGKQGFDLHMERHEFQKGGLCARVADCGSDETFTAITAWEAHLRSKHSDGNMPERVCPVEGCTRHARIRLRCRHLILKLEVFH
jgi:hypothetical protein